jgi:small subunit ribosomal protein S1
VWKDARNALKEGDTVSAMIINIDRKSRAINLSIKAKDSADQQDTMISYRVMLALVQRI